MQFYATRDSIVFMLLQAELSRLLQNHEGSGLQDKLLQTPRTSILGLWLAD